MGELKKPVSEIVNRLNEEKSKKPNIDIIAKITRDVAGDNVKCYPGIPGDRCYNVAYFYSLDKRSFRGTRGKDLSLDAVFSTMVQHMLGSCEAETRFGVLITDSWNENIFQPWKSTFDKIRKSAYIEIYMMRGNGFVEIEI